MDIESIKMKQTILGSGRVRYVKGKSYSPPFSPEFEKDILPMVDTHPQLFDVFRSVTNGIADKENTKTKASVFPPKKR